MQENYSLSREKPVPWQTGCRRRVEYARGDTGLEKMEREKERNNCEAVDREKEREIEEGRGRERESRNREARINNSME